jgi:hypothetical protein
MGNPTRRKETRMESGIQIEEGQKRERLEDLSTVRIREEKSPANFTILGGA